MAGLAKKVYTFRPARGSPAGVRVRAKVARVPGCACAATWSVREGGEGRGPLPKTTCYFLLLLLPLTSILLLLSNIHYTTTTTTTTNLYTTATI